MYSQFEKDRDQGNFELLPELHAILSGMKVHPHCPSLPLLAQRPLTSHKHLHDAFFFCVNRSVTLRLTCNAAARRAQGRQLCHTKLTCPAGFEHMDYM